MLGAALMVVLLTLIAIGLYNAFPDEEIEVTKIELNNVISGTDYRVESIQCQCQNEELEEDIAETAVGYACKRRILSQTQRAELPQCSELEEPSATRVN